MLVRELMTPDPVTVTPSTHVKAALELLVEHGITAMPVVGEHGVQGVVSEADLIRDLVRDDPRSHELLHQPPGAGRPDYPRTVGEVMTPHAVTVHPDTDVATAVELLTSTTVKSVPVVDHEERLVGILSRSDVVRVLARSDQDLVREVTALLASVGLDDWLADVEEGRVRLTGPDHSPVRTAAQLVAGTVPGVVEVLGD